MADPTLSGRPETFALRMGRHGPATTMTTKECFHMLRVKVLGAALIAMFAFSAVAAAGASAHQFKSSSFPLLLLAHADGPQLFTTLAGHLLCTSLTGHGIVEASVAKTQKTTVAYRGCTASVGAVKATPDEPILAEYEFNAEGTVSILKPITILATLAGLKCTITVAAQGPLSSVGFDNTNSNKAILLLSHVKEILNSAVGAGCGAQYTNLRDALYKGNALVLVDPESESITWE